MKVKILRTNNGGEYTSHTFSASLSHHGIIHQTTCPSTLEQNGVTETKNCHLLEVTHALLFHIQVPKVFWADILQAVVYLMHRMPSCVLGFRALKDLLHESFDSSLPPKNFGCVCYVHNPKSQRSKLDPKALKCIFLGYALSIEGYKCYHPPTRHRLVSMDATFHESFFFF